MTTVAAGGGDAARLRKRGSVRPTAFAAAINEGKQLAAKADHFIDGRHAFGSLRRIGRRLTGTYRLSQIVEPAALIGGKIDRLQLKRDGEQPRATFVGELKRLFRLAPLQSGEGRLGKQRPGVGNERPRLDFRNPLAEQQKKRFARARVNGRNERPFTGFHQHPAEQPRRAQMIERCGIAGKHRQCRLKLATACCRLLARSPRTRSAYIFPRLC